MQLFIFVHFAVWLALALWFVGAFARIGTGRADRRLYGWAWLVGSLVMWVHIAGSYALVYEWSHADAVAATADESLRVTGIRAGWGVYVNFAFAIMWTIASLILVAGKPMPLAIDRIVFWFTAAIVMMSTVVFEPGAVRIVSASAFVGLAVFARRRSGGC